MLLPALLASLTTPLEAAHADGGDAARMDSYVLPLYAKAPDLTELRQPNGFSKLQRLAGTEASQPFLPRETVGPAKSYAPLSAEDSSTPAVPTEDTLAAAAGPVVSLPEPSHSMTPAECVLGLGTSKFYVKSRFAVCSGTQMNQVWLVNGEPVGTSSFDVLAIGTIPKNSRTVTVTYYFTDFTAAGTNDAPDMGITTNGKIAQSWPASVKYTQGGVAMPATRTWAQLLESGSFKHMVSAAAGQGSAGARTDSEFAAYQPSVEIKAPPGWVVTNPGAHNFFMLPPRWDKAAYLPSKTTGAAAFSILPTLQYSTAAKAPERGVALHIQKAFTKPFSTVPPTTRKDFPGQTADAPLTRLYWDSARRKDNYNVSVYNCKKYFGAGYTQNNTKECDEYPFQSTYEGAARWKHDHLGERNNFSVMPVKKAENGAAGILLAQFYDNNRILDGPDDGFLVRIVA
ncbi:NucA/NucB deoxyribonuclease domain-containing protein [Streptomyces sp. CA-106110]|uniref:NucA/NucB deoxyribonuclease domain-containing protein n=1 Tax=Streptomyces sp. CA-106110 TaxID=3240044 RepID=UPI003D8E65A0